MQIDIHLEAIEHPALVPRHYNVLIQGIIYQHLDTALAAKTHDMGWKDGPRRLKLFTFSRLQGKFRSHHGYLEFLGAVQLRIASPATSFLESLATHLIRAKTVHLGKASFRVASVEVLISPPYLRPVHLKALSPITVYSTLEAPDGRKKTYYYAPQEPEFGQQVLANLRRKIRAWTGEDIPPDGATFRPVRVSNRNLVIARYKSTVIKGWTGIYELDAPEPYLRMALDAGLGAKNSQGFGFVEVWEGKRNHMETRGAQRKNQRSHRDTGNTTK